MGALISFESSLPFTRALLFDGSRSRFYKRAVVLGCLHLFSNPWLVSSEVSVGGLYRSKGLDSD